MSARELFIPSPVEEVARRALAVSAGIDPSQVPAVLPRAVATGTGDRAAVADAARGLGERAGLDLVRFDTDRIASYVFESSRPPVLAGASKVLRDLNAEIARDYTEWTLFSAGGEGLLLAPRGRGAEICREIEERFRRDSVGALGVTTAWVPANAEDFLADPVAGGSGGEASEGVRVVTGTQAVLSRLHDAIRKKKDEAQPLRAPVAGDQPRCVSCRDRCGDHCSVARFRTDEQGSLCHPCAKRWEIGKKLIAGDSFDDLIARWTGARPEGTRRDSYLGFLYADGNGMGALFGQLDSLAELQILSGEVTACFAALRERVHGAVGALLTPDPAEAPLFLDLLAGGDEVIWILPAALAVHVAERLPAWLDAEVQARPGLVELLAQRGRSSLSVGIGLALTGLGYPVRYQYQLAKALQKEAKQRSTVEGRDASTIDFEVLTDSSPLSDDLETLRRWLGRTDEAGFYRTCRPLDHADMTRIRKQIEVALGAELALSQLYTLAAGSHDGRRPFLNLVRYQLARKPASARYRRWLEGCRIDLAEPDQIESFFVWPTPRGRGLWIDDALALLPFLDALPDRSLEGRT